MRCTACLWCCVATAGLLLAGCGKVDNTPPKTATTDTPVLDIEEGTQVSPDELQKPPTDEPPAP